MRGFAWIDMARLGVTPGAVLGVAGLYRDLFMSHTDASNKLPFTF